MFFKETTIFIIFNLLTFYTKKLFEHYQFQIGGLFYIYTYYTYIDIIKIILQNRPSFMCIKSAPYLHLKSANRANVLMVLFDALLILLTDFTQISPK